MYHSEGCGSKQFSLGWGHRVQGVLVWKEVSFSRKLNKWLMILVWTWKLQIDTQKVKFENSNLLITQFNSKSVDLGIVWK